MYTEMRISLLSAFLKGLKASKCVRKLTPLIFFFYGNTKKLIGQNVVICSINLLGHLNGLKASGTLTRRPKYDTDYLNFDQKGYSE
jgi:hypothetical protein